MNQSITHADGSRTVVEDKGDFELVTEYDVLGNPVQTYERENLFPIPPIPPIELDATQIFPEMRDALSTITPSSTSATVRTALLNLKTVLNSTQE